MVMRESQDRITSSSSEWVLSFLPALSETELTALARSHPLFVSATTAGRVPATREIAGAGRDLAAQLWGSLPPDDFIHRGLEAESALYFSIESALGAVDLKALVAGGQADLNQVLSWAMSIQQSRKSRRGQSLQHHFSFLLSREAVPYSAQARTEGSETPDFLIPGEENYHDPDFPATRLRMVACKSTVRERWGQILKEANRIPEKHLLTVDENLAADVITKMRASNLRVFVPAPIILDHYGTCAASDLLGTVNDLLVDLKATL
ncbi:MAG TPA: type II restriction endonuclease [Gemmatimonadales bacterium]|nr:type II restriction endonuclease [Gemmatimonadales bacterium]